jgi:sigma-B regulation protein RsbQ
MSCFAKLHGRRGGSGTITAILSHGFGTDQDAWSELLPWFQERFDVITFDLAGCGPDGAKSYDFDHHGSMFGYADDLIDLMDELGLRDCLFVGHSMSGMVGATAATARPELFARLVMIGASPRYLNDADYVGGFEQPDLDHLFESMAANYQAWVAGFAPMVVGVDDSEAIADFSRTLFQMRPDVALATSRTIFGSDMRQTARRLSRPVHLIQTASDVAVPPEVGVWLSDVIQNATLDIIDASGHLPHITATGEVLRILERRLANILS